MDGAFESAAFTTTAICWEQSAMRAMRAVVWIAFLSVALRAGGSEFAGWEGYRVIQQDGRPYVLRAADVDSDGRDELIVVNSRFSRLDLYRWASPEERQPAETPPADQPNDLPMARELARDEIQLEHVPQDVVLADIDGDKQTELVVLVSPPNRIVIYAPGDDGKWQVKFQLDLLEAEYASRRGSLLLRKTSDVSYEALVSCTDGIQRLALVPGSRGEWLSPREKRRRTAWWLADLDGDGRPDLIEQGAEAATAIRWYRCAEEGQLAPAEVLLDRAVGDMEVVGGHGGAQIAVLDGAVKDLLRRYRLTQGPPSGLGQRHPLALSGGNRVAWCGLRQGEDRALVVADAASPRLLSYVLNEDGWQPQRAYPATSDIRALVAPSAQPGTLLIWAKDAADLQVSRWEAGRLTYPQKWDTNGDAGDRQIVALSSVGETTWWAQRAEKQLDLYLWPRGSAAPQAIQFENVGTKVEQVLWIGGERALIKESRSRAIKLVQKGEGGKTITKSPTHLKKASLAEFHTQEIAGEVRLARLVDGVLQWIGDDLHSQDQIMLPQGMELASYVGQDADAGWALQQNSPYIHQLEADQAGIKQSVARIKVDRGDELVADPVLGMLLVGHNRITHLSPGQPNQLQLVDVADQRIGRSRGIKKTNLHRLATVDLDRSGLDELVIFDDLEHRLTVVGCESAHINPLISWPVFDDKIYPYSDDASSVVREPRALVGLDIDGDAVQDLALICHDRLLLYLAHESP